MSRLPKPKLPAVSTPTSPGELAQKIKSLSRGDSRVLAASSTAIALSIASPFYNIRETPNNDITTHGRDNGWQTAYGAARMAVEVAKESSDMFLPLKAVANAMSALIKNYDVSMSFWQPEHLLILILYLFPLQQTSNNVEMVKEVERRVQTLSGALASPISEDDHAEKGRRTELRVMIFTVFPPFSL